MKRYAGPLLTGCAIASSVWSQIALVDGGVWRTRSLIGLAIIFAECMAIGMIVFLGRPLLLLVVVPAMAWQIRRVRRERRVLEDAFGDEYRRYRSRTWF